MRDRSAPSRWRLAARLALALGSLCAAPIARADCGDTLPAAGRQRVEVAGAALVYAPSRWPIPVGEPFALALAVCGEAPPALRRVDADMPLHRHGMNYRVALQALGGGHHRAEGLLFHMPGRWRLQFELGEPGAPLRLAHELDVK